MPIAKLSYTFLAIEDNPGDFYLIHELLEERFELKALHHAPTFADARKMLGNPELKLDVILLDLSLPDASGESLVNDIISLAGRIPVIALTGNDDLEFSIRSISSGISDYIIKDGLTADFLYKSINYSIERNKINLQLKESEERFIILFQQSPQPAYVYDPATGRIVFANRAASALLGYTTEEFTGMHIRELVYEEDRELADEMVADVLSTDQHSYAEEIRFIEKSGAVHMMELYGTGIVIEGRQLRSVIAIDVTEKLQFENKLTRAIIHTQEDERYEIGTELHDNVCQILASSQMYMSMLFPKLDSESVPLLDQAKDNTVLAIREIRNLSHRLAPAFFEESSLEDSLDRLIGDFILQEDTKVELAVSEKFSTRKPGQDIQLNLYRIIQEQMRNIQKYAKATNVEVVVDIQDEHLVLSVRDNGIGFDMSTVKKGIGIANMRRRAALFGGKTTIISSPGNGCEVQVIIPLQQELQ